MFRRTQSILRRPSAASSGVKRSVFIDDLVFSIAMDRVKVQDLGKLGKDLADIKLL